METPILNGTYSDLKIKLIVNAPSLTSSYILDNLVIADSELDTDSESESETLVSYSLSFPSDLEATDMLLSTTGELKINDGVLLPPAQGATGSVFSSGTTDTNIGANVLVGDVRSKSNVLLRSYAHVNGIVAAAGTLEVQEGATITHGRLSTVPGTRDVSWEIPFPADTTNVFVEPEQNTPIDPGDYGTVNLKSRSALIMSSGVYTIQNLTLEPDSVVIIDDYDGPCFIFVRDEIKYSGRVLSVHDAGNFVLGYSGINTVHVEAPFMGGTLLVPNAKIELKSVRQGHTGSFFAKDVEIHQWTTVSYTFPGALQAFTDLIRIHIGIPNSHIIELLKTLMRRPSGITNTCEIGENGICPEGTFSLGYNLCIEIPDPLPSCSPSDLICDSGFTCIGGTCYPETNVPLGGCSDDPVCPNLIARWARYRCNKWIDNQEEKTQCAIAAGPGTACMLRNSSPDGLDLPFCDLGMECIGIDGQEVDEGEPGVCKIPCTADDDCPCGTDGVPAFACNTEGVCDYCRASLYGSCSGVTGGECCNPDHVCEMTDTFKGQCKIAAGAACTEDDQCAYREGTETTLPMACVSGQCQEQHIALGEDCSYDFHCDTGLVCSDGECLIPSGGTCTGTGCVSGLECIGGTCQTPPACTPGGSCKVSGKKGPCADGTITCNGSEPVCTQTVQPTTETCDKIDNDCDGTTDEDIAATECQTTLGLCQDGFSAPGLMTCANGSLVCEARICKDGDTSSTKCVCKGSVTTNGLGGYPCGLPFGFCNPGDVCTPGSQCQLTGEPHYKPMCVEICNRYLDCWTPSQVTIGSGCTP